MWASWRPPGHPKGPCQLGLSGRQQDAAATTRRCRQRPQHTHCGRVTGAPPTREHRAAPGTLSPGPAWAGGRVLRRGQGRTEMPTDGRGDGSSGPGGTCGCAAKCAAAPRRWASRRGLRLSLVCPTSVRVDRVTACAFGGRASARGLRSVAGEADPQNAPRSPVIRGTAAQRVQGFSSGEETMESEVPAAQMKAPNGPAWRAWPRGVCGREGRLPRHDQASDRKVPRGQTESGCVCARPATAREGRPCAGWEGCRGPSAPKETSLWLLTCCGRA